MARQSELVHSYCDAVEATLDAHPIQAAQELLPAHAFQTAADLYAYTVCPFDANGEALAQTAPADAVRWIIFDNVYARERGGLFPRNHILRKARNAGFRPEGQPKGSPHYDPQRAADVWKGAISQWGPPRGFASPVDAAGPEASVTTPPLPVRQPAAAPRQPNTASETATTPWAQGIVDRTHALWQSLEGKYPFWTSGFAVFYSPVAENAKVVLVGANPGGDASSFSLPRASTVPSIHDYLAYNYKLAEKMRDLFDRAGRPDLLRQSVKLNLNFFRSRSQAEWKTAPSVVREEMESQSRRAVLEILNRLKPEIVLAEGTATYNALRELLAPAEPSEVIVESPGGRAYVRSKIAWGGLLIGIIHPTGARYSSATWQALGTALGKDLAGV